MRISELLGRLAGCDRRCWCSSLFQSALKWDIQTEATTLDLFGTFAAGIGIFL